MYTLVKLGFWFGLVLFFMPLGNGGAETAPQVSAVEALYAAKEAGRNKVCLYSPETAST